MHTGPIQVGWGAVTSTPAGPQHLFSQVQGESGSQAGCVAIASTQQDTSCLWHAFIHAFTHSILTAAESLGWTLVPTRPSPYP